MKIHTRILWDSDGTEILDDFYRYDGPIAHLGGGSSQKQTQQTSTGPWSAQQPYLTKGFDAALQNYNSDKPSFYPGSTVTPFSGATQQGMGLIQGLADSSKLPGQAAQQVGSTATGGYQADPQSWIRGLTNPNMNASNPYANASNPYANASNPNINASNPNMGQDPNAYIDQVTTAATRAATSGVHSQYAGAGRTGDSPIAQAAIARGIADSVAPLQFGSAEAAQQRSFTSGENLAQRQFTGGENQAQRQYASGENLAQRQSTSGESLAQRQFTGGQNAVAQGMSAYDAERQRQLTAAGMAPATDAAQYAPAQELMGIGAQQEQKSGQTLQDQIDRFNFDQNLPQQKLADYMAMVSGNYGQAGTNVTNANQQMSGAQQFATIGQGVGSFGKALGK